MKQVDQVNASNGRLLRPTGAAALVGIVGITRCPHIGARADAGGKVRLTVIVADTLGLLDDVRSSSPQHVERRGWGPQIECRAANRRQAEVILSSWGWTPAQVSANHYSLERSSLGRPICNGKGSEHAL
jgi:hypothetical protein